VRRFARTVPSGNGRADGERHPRGPARQRAKVEEGVGKTNDPQRTLHGQHHEHRKMRAASRTSNTPSTSWELRRRYAPRADRTLKALGSHI
jgi:hypothetical protein